MTATALKVEKVAMHFGGLVALSDMNFAVGEGEIVSLIGPNGAGKTTAFNIVTGFLDPTHGAVSYRRPRSDPDLPAHQRISERHRLRQSARRAASAGQGEPS